MDQRGTLFTDPALLCPESDRARASTVGLRYDSDESGTLLVDASRECYERLMAEGVDLGAYNSKQNAADFADLRKALGIKEWNVYGVSYGTDLALTYMREHPEGIRSVAIDSVVPPYTVMGDFWTNAGEG